jgi:HD-GYP domain-containing protein (c-di-GMP phosphodiesterase class II)
MFTVFIGCVVIHPPQTGFLIHATQFELLLLCALVFLLLDFSLFSLSQSLSSGEPMLATFKSTLREGMTFEAVQYLIAIVGALAVREEIWSIVLIIIPILITYTAFKNMKEMHFETARILEDMADTVDLRDVYTGGHSKRVAEWARKILTQLDIAGPEAMMIETAARLHDIGKIGLPDSILKKPGKLLLEEIPVMQTHTQKGADLIEKYKDFSRGAVMIKHHHERWDGDGYPSRLKNYEIPFGARVIAVADAFDAMTSDRPYRAAMTTQQAIKILLGGRDSQWDGRVVDALVQAVIEELKEDAAQVHALYRLVTSASG